MRRRLLPLPAASQPIWDSHGGGIGWSAGVGLARAAGRVLYSKHLERGLSLPGVRPLSPR
jgi:hypothetical protein